MNNTADNRRVDPVFITHVLLAMIFGALIWAISVLNDVNDSLEMTEYNTTELREALKGVKSNTDRIR